MKPSFYANKVDCMITETEVILDCKLKADGRPTEQVRLILPHDTAAKLGVLLAPKEEDSEAHASESSEAP